jgi:hypothetical protein
MFRYPRSGCGPDVNGEQQHADEHRDVEVHGAGEDLDT